MGEAAHKSISMHKPTRTHTQLRMLRVHMHSCAEELQWAAASSGGLLEALLAVLYATAPVDLIQPSRPEGMSLLATFSGQACIQHLVTHQKCRLTKSAGWFDKRTPIAHQ